MKHVDWTLARYIIAWLCSLFAMLLLGAESVLSQEWLLALGENKRAVINTDLRWSIIVLASIAVSTIIVDAIVKRARVDAIMKRAAIKHTEQEDEWTL